MNIQILVLSSLLIGLQLVIPRAWGFVPLLAAAFHLGNVEILGDLTTVRLIILIGCLRAIPLGTLSFSLRRPVDRAFALLVAWLILASLFRHPANGSNPLISNLGIVWNCLGTFVYGRAYFSDPSAGRRLCVATALLLVPLAVGMAYEKTAGRNAYYVLGASSEQALSRNGTIRAQGPFRHPILAGTAGTVSLPLAHYLLQVGRPVLGAVGLLAGATMIISAASSGPIAAAMIYLAALFFWPRRPLLRSALITAGILAIIYPVITGRGPWYLMARIDFTGGSTGWHRAYLIDRSITFLQEWWLFGTDYTRHWMPTGVSWNEDHSDLTNYFLHLGVAGGLPVSIALAAVLFGAFRRLQRLLAVETGDEQRLLWALGTSLASHTLSFISISYFDQMFVVVYLLLALIFQNRPEPEQADQRSQLDDGVRDPRTEPLLRN